MAANNIKPEDLHAKNAAGFTNTTKAGSFSPKPAQKINKKATSTKPQDPSVDNFKASSIKRPKSQAASDKPQAPSHKHQATSRKQQALESGDLHKVSSHKHRGS